MHAVSQCNTPVEVVGIFLMLIPITENVALRIDHELLRAESAGR